MAIEARALDRILAGTPGTLSVSFDDDGTLADPGDVTVTITRADGTVIVTDGPTDGTGAAARTYALTAAQTASLDVLTAVWKSATLGTVTTQAEVVGAHLFTLNAARGFDQQQLSDAGKYPASALEEARARITDQFEDICGVSFIPRYDRVILDGSGDTVQLLPGIKVRSIRSIEYRAPGSATWTAYTTDDLADVYLDAGVLVRETRGTFLRGRRNLRVGYEHGFERPPLEISRAGLKVLVASQVPTNLSDRARSYSDNSGTFNLSVAGFAPNSWSARAYYGIPEVDEILSRYQYTLPAVG